MDKKTVAIIGAGIGGMALSILLAKNGFDVVIYEKNPNSGGRCSQLHREGHRFDLGATILLMPSIYRTVFESLGLNFDECFELKDLSTIYKLYFGDGEKLIISKNPEVMKPQLEKIEPGSFNRFEAYIKKGYSFFQESYQNLLSRNFHNLFKFTTPINVRMFFRLKVWLRHYTFVRRYFKNENLQQAFTFQNIYVGQSPLKAPALFAMLPATELTEGALFPIGGMHKITSRLETEALKAGVRFIFNTTVEKIGVEKGRVTRLFFGEESSPNYDLIVANADLPYVYQNLLPKRNVFRGLESRSYACSAIVFHWGLKKAYPQFAHHSVFLSKDFSKSLDAIFTDHSISANPSFYVHAPVRTDPLAAPPDQDTFSVIVPMGHLDEKNPQDWDAIKKQVRTDVLKRLTGEGFADLEESIKFELCYTPLAWKSIYNVSRGSVFGSIGHTIFQMGYFRPHNRHSRYRNLYFVGGSTHPGNGVPLVLLSARLTSERILKENL